MSTTRLRGTRRDVPPTHSVRRTPTARERRDAAHRGIHCAADISRPVSVSTIMASGAHRWLLMSRQSLHTTSESVPLYVLCSHRHTHASGRVRWGRLHQ